MSQIDPQRVGGNVAIAAAAPGDPHAPVELLYIVPHVAPIQVEVLGNRLAFLLFVIAPSCLRQHGDDVERSMIAVTEQPLEEDADFLPIEQVRHGCLGRFRHRVRRQPGQPHVAVREARHEVDVFQRHVGVPTANHLPHGRGVERFHGHGRYPSRIRRGTTPDGNEPHAAGGALHRIAQGLKSLRLRFVGDHHHAYVRLACHAVDQLGQTDIFGLADVDHRVAPRGATAQLKGESGLSDSRMPLDVQMMDRLGFAHRVEIELASSFGQSGLDLRRRLIGHSMFAALRPVVPRR